MVYPYTNPSLQQGEYQNNNLKYILPKVMESQGHKKDS